MSLLERDVVAQKLRCRRGKRGMEQNLCHREDTSDARQQVIKEMDRSATYDDEPCVATEPAGMQMWIVKWHVSERDGDAKRHQSTGITADHVYNRCKETHLSTFTLESVLKCRGIISAFIFDSGCQHFVPPRIYTVPSFRDVSVTVICCG